METQTALSIQKNKLQPSRQKYKATFSGRPLIWRQQPRTPSSESGVPRNRITRPAKSATSRLASALAPFRQHSCRAYTITHSKYHGHRRRHNGDAVHSAVQPPQEPHTLITFFLFQDPTFGQPLQRTESSDLSQEGKPRRQKALRTKGILRWYLSMIVIPVLHTHMRPSLG